MTCPASADNPQHTAQRQWFFVRQRVFALLSFLLLDNRMSGRLRAALLRMNGAAIGRRCFVRGGLQIQESFRFTLGDDVFVNSGCMFDGSAAIEIGDRVQLGFQVTLVTGDHRFGPADSRAGDHCARAIRIGEGVWIGARAVIFPGVTIGRGAVVAAGAVVTRDVEADALVAGVPARVVRMLTAAVSEADSGPRGESVCEREFGKRTPGMTQKDARTQRYRFGFVLTTAAGNQTRYLNLRKYAEQDPEVESVWAPISHYLEPNPFRLLPGPLRTRMVVARQARPVMGRLDTMDAVLFHAFEPYAWTALRSLARSRPRIVWSQDNPPLADPAAHTQARYGEEYARPDGSAHPEGTRGSPTLHPQSRYGGEYARPDWRVRMRFAFDRWCAGRTALFLPFSAWGAEVLTRDCRIPSYRVRPIHVGLDLDVWPYVPGDPQPRRAKILFVGGDFERKGGLLLVDAFRRFADRAELHLVTNRAPECLPEHVTVHPGLVPNDPGLRRLYAECDLFVLPTRADMSSWAALEAMATGRPVVISGTGGIPDLIEEGKSGFLIPPDDRAALEDRIRQLLDEPELRIRVGAAARARVERHFNAAINVPAILDAMKRAVDGSPGAPGPNA